MGNGSATPGFDEWLQRFPWLYERGGQCIISADLDGLACGMLQASTLGWQVIGTYDGAALCLFVEPSGVRLSEAPFLDVEILRRDVRSVGNHLFAEDAADVERLRADLPHCLNPNLWRGINVRESFQRKYPFGTLPMLLAARCLTDREFEVSEDWLALALHTDSGFTNAAVYQANALEWLHAMRPRQTGGGLSRFCDRLESLSAKDSLRLLDRVQRWSGDAGFGRLQRACRFDPRNARERERARSLAQRLTNELKTTSKADFLDREPVYAEQFTT